MQGTVSTFLFFRHQRNLLAIQILPFILLSLVSSGALSADYRFLDNAPAATSVHSNPLPGESPTRIKYDLSGTWDYSIDGVGSGTVAVPSVFDFAGRVAFQRTFRPSADSLSRFRFHFVALGISQTAEVSVNNDFITNHAGGYTEIVQNIPPNTISASRDNVLRVVVGNQLDYRKGFPLHPFPWTVKQYGGIHRDIYLLGTPPVYISGASVNSTFDAPSGKGHLTVKLKVDRSALPDEPASSYSCVVDVVDRISGIPIAHGGPAAIAGEEPVSSSSVLDFSLPAVKSWSPDSPDLYLLRCSLLRTADRSLVDEYDVSCGIREIKAEGGEFLLNGKRIILKGVVWNEDAPGHGNILTYEQMERDVAQIKTLRANAIRFIHHPPHPWMLDLCDRYGLLAMVELPLTSIPSQLLSDESVIEPASTMLREMIMQNGSHPCILAWGLGDDVEMTMGSREALRKLIGIAKSLDNRPLYAFTQLIDDDSCSGLFDVAALTVNSPDLKEFKSRLEGWQSLHQAPPVVVTFGTEVQQSNRRGYTDPLSQEAQARFYLQRFDALRAADCDGAFINSYNDWKGAGPSLAVQSGDPLLHMVGLVSGDREKRMAFDAVRAIFNGEKYAALPVGSYSSKAPIVFVLAGFVVLVGMVYFYNSNRRFRESLNRSVLNAYNFFSDIRDQHPVSAGHTFLLGVGVSAGTGLVLSSIAFHFRGSRLLDGILTLLLISDGIKSTVVHMIWEPLLSMASVAVAVFIGLLFVSLVTFGIRVFFRQRVYFMHGVAVTFWSTAPFLLFIPVGMIIYRLLDSQFYVVPMLALFFLLHVWVALRLFKGLAIVYDVPPAKMFFAAWFFVLLIAASAYIYYDYAFSAPLYVHYIYHIAAHAL